MCEATCFCRQSLLLREDHRHNNCCCVNREVVGLAVGQVLFMGQQPPVDRRDNLDGTYTYYSSPLASGRDQLSAAAGRLLKAPGAGGSN